MAAIRERGLRIEGIWGEHLIRGLRPFTERPAKCPGSTSTWFSLPRSPTTPATRRSKSCRCSRKTAWSSRFRMVWGTWRRYRQIVGDHRAVGGRLIFGIEIPEAGRAEITVYADKVMLGSPSHKVDFARLEAIAAAFTEAGIPTEATLEIGQFIWGKVFYNCCLNPLSALLEVTYGELSEHSGDQADHDVCDRGDLRRGCARKACPWRGGHRRSTGRSSSAGSFRTPMPIMLRCCRM